MDSMFRTSIHQSKNLPALAVASWLLLGATLYAQDWKVAPFPAQDNLTGVIFRSPDTGYVVSSSGKIARTTDTGATWRAVQVTDGSLEDVYFDNARTVYVCGSRGGVYKSEDGGRTWKNISVKDTSAVFISVKRLSLRSLVVLGLKPDTATNVRGVGYRSTDDGLTWTPLPPMGLSYGEMFVSPDKTARFLSWGSMHTSNDFGKTWVKSKLPEGKPGRTIDIIGNTGIMAGMFGQIGYSSDGGKIWKQVTITDENSHFTSAVLVNKQEGYIAGYDSRLYHTTNAGHAWMREQLPKDCVILAMTKSANRIWAVGTEGAIFWKPIR
ncbi:MAG: hypothetical protein HY851_02210 [candidate division Zixibacteria bacterium]|nr:hypothetical protein [candidate division Zixibacteria bacterium]